LSLTDADFQSETTALRCDSGSLCRVIYSILTPKNQVEMIYVKLDSSQTVTLP